MPTEIVQNRPCVLIVEQDAVTRELLQHKMHLGGFASVAVRTGEQALLLLREHRGAIDWLVTSRTLPGLVDGRILADEFHSYHPMRAVLLGADLISTAQLPDRLPDCMERVSPVDIVATLRALHEAARVDPGHLGGAQAIAA
jgi:CheY-like chemotaxis protein